MAKTSAKRRPPPKPAVGLIMGSQSDWATMRHAAETLAALGVASEKRIVSAHRTPDRLFAFARGAKAAGFKVIIAGAGGAAHLAGVLAAKTTCRLAIDGVAQSVTRDSLGRVSAVVNPLGTSTYGYDGPTGRFADITYPNRQTTTFTYFANANDRRLLQIHHRDKDGHTLSRFEHGYDVQGTITRWTQPRSRGLSLYNSESATATMRAA
jgi:5-(carboxyamino)imidazole ribonucleotide mutase